MADIHDKLADLGDAKIVSHVEAALNFERKRQPVLQVNSKRASSRMMCNACGVGIRKETTPVNGRHPKCDKVANDATLALTMPVNSHAARVLNDRHIVVDGIAEKKRNAETLATFEAAEAAREAAEAS